MPGLDLRPTTSPPPGDGAQGVLEAAKRKLNSEADAAVVRAVLHPDGAPSAEAERARVDLVGRTAEVYNGALDRLTAELQEARAASAGAYQNGKEDAERIAKVELSALERAHEAQMAFIRALSDERKAADERHQQTVEALRAEIGALRDQMRQAEVGRLQEEINALKAKVSAPPVPAGAKVVTLPDGTQAVQLPQANGHSGSSLSGFIAQLQELAKARRDLLDALGVPTTPAADPNDPDQRWKHMHLDWMDEDRKAARADRSRLTDAQIRREEAVAKAWAQLPGVAREVLQRARPWIPRVLGGAPEHGEHNGVPDRPPDEAAS